MSRATRQCVIAFRTIHCSKYWPPSRFQFTRTMSMTGPPEIVPLKPRIYHERPVTKIFETDYKIYELRKYSVNPSDMPSYLNLTKERLSLRTNHSKLLGFWTSEIGALGQSIHIWEYDNLEHRTQVRAALSKDPEWQSQYIKEAIPKLISQDNSVLIPFSWGKIKTPSTKGVYELQTYYMTSHLDVWQDRLKRVIDTRQACIEPFNSILVGAFYTLFGRNNTAVVLWQHEDFDKSVKGKLKLLTEEKDSSMAAFYHEVESSYSIGMLPFVVSPMQ